MSQDNHKPLITIDGPAASGKSTISREIARRFGIPWVSTGAFYRGLAYVALQKNMSLEDVSGLAKLARSSEWSIQMTENKTKVVYNSEDVTEQISHEDVGSFASRISSYPGVREALLEGQRKCYQASVGLVAEGRDCGTVVFPFAKIKIYVTASSENRAARRAVEHGADAEDILKAQKERDHQDTSRKTAPLQVPPQAWVIDTTHLSLPEAIHAVEAHIQEQLHKT